MKISVDIRDIKELERHLKTFKAKAYPFATKSTLNSAAFAAQDISKKRIRNTLVLRNKFIVQSVRVNQTKTLDVARQAAFIGSTAGGMEVQEFGGVKIKKGKHGVALPSAFSAGQQPGSKPRRQLPRPANTLRRLRLQKKRRQPKTKNQAVLFKVQDAIQSGKRTFFHDFGSRGGAGIFRVKGGRKGFKRGWPKGAKMKRLYSLEHKTVSIPRKPWLRPSAIVAQKRMPALYVKSLRFQLHKHNLFSS